MNTPSPITPQDPELLKAQLASFDAQLAALDSKRDATISMNTTQRAAVDAQNQAQYLQQKGNLARQRKTIQDQIDALTPKTDAPSAQ